jgi:hypothetical protein
LYLKLPAVRTVARAPGEIWTYPNIEAESLPQYLGMWRKEHMPYEKYGQVLSGK